MNSVKIIITTIFLIIICYTQESFAESNYNNAVQELIRNNDFYSKVSSILKNDALGFFAVGLHSSNIDLFESGVPNCNLSDKNNICFQKIVRMEAVISIAKEQKLLLDTTPFYTWKEAVLRGENIQPYLDELLDKNFSTSSD